MKVSRVMCRWCFRGMMVGLLGVLGAEPGAAGLWAQESTPPPDPWASCPKLKEVWEEASRGAYAGVEGVCAPAAIEATCPGTLWANACIKLREAQLGAAPGWQSVMVEGFLRQMDEQLRLGGLVSERMDAARRMARVGRLQDDRDPLQSSSGASGRLHDRALELFEESLTQLRQVLARGAGLGGTDAELKEPDRVALLADYRRELLWAIRRDGLKRPERVALRLASWHELSSVLDGSLQKLPAADQAMLRLTPAQVQSERSGLPQTLDVSTVSRASLLLGQYALLTAGTDLAFEKKWLEEAFRHFEDILLDSGAPEPVGRAARVAWVHAMSLSAGSQADLFTARESRVDSVVSSLLEKPAALEPGQLAQLKDDFRPIYYARMELAGARPGRDGLLLALGQRVQALPGDWAGRAALLQVGAASAQRLKREPEQLRLAQAAFSEIRGRYTLPPGDPVKPLLQPLWMLPTKDGSRDFAGTEPEAIPVLIAQLEGIQNVLVLPAQEPLRVALLQDLNRLRGVKPPEPSDPGNTPPEQGGKTEQGGDSGAQPPSGTPSGTYVARIAGTSLGLCMNGNLAIEYSFERAMTIQSDMSASIPEFTSIIKLLNNKESKRVLITKLLGHIPTDKDESRTYNVLCKCEMSERRICYASFSSQSTPSTCSTMNRPIRNVFALLVSVSAEISEIKCP